MMMTMTMATLAMMDGWMDDMTTSMREGKRSSPRTKKTVGKEQSPCKRHSLPPKRKTLFSVDITYFDDDEDVLEDRKSFRQDVARTFGFSQWL